MFEPDLTLGDIVYHSPQLILAHPGFARARADYVDAVLGLYQGEPFLTRLVQEAGRSVMFILIICLYAKYDPADRKTWPTLALLQQKMTQFALSSPRRVEALVGRLIHSDFLHAVPSPRDRRARILTPTETMYATDRDWLAAHYVPLQFLFPDPGYASMIQRDPAIQQAQRMVSVDFISQGAGIMSGNPGIMLFMARDAGMLILMKLLQMRGQQLRGARDAEALSYADIGERFGVSRTHVRILLKDAEAAGLVGLAGRGGRFVELKEPILQAFDRFVAESMSGHDLIFQMAQRRLLTPPDATA